MTDFTDLLSRFAKAVAANDGAGFAALFTEDGVYDDGFFGEYKGRKAIVEMLQHFHDTGSNYRWDFFDALSDGRTGYARYRFSYASGMPGAEGKPVVFEGISHFVFRDGAIARYEEFFDRGMALAQQDFAAERIKKVLKKLADRQNASPAAKEHLARFGYGFGSHPRACAALPLVARNGPFPGRDLRIRAVKRCCRSSVVEHFIGNEEVGGSIPPDSTRFPVELAGKASP